MFLIRLNKAVNKLTCIRFTIEMQNLMLRSLDFHRLVISREHHASMLMEFVLNYRIIWLFITSLNIKLSTYKYFN